MGTDRVQIYLGPCLCGAGKFRVDECSPDHPWAKPGQEWLEADIECASCAKKYSISPGPHSLSVFLKEDVEADRKVAEIRTQAWHAKAAEVREYIEQRCYDQMISNWLESLPSKAAIHRAVLPILGMGRVGTYQTFLKHLRRDVKGWVKREFDATAVAAALGVMGSPSDPKLVDLNREVEQLWNERRVEPTASPVQTILY